MVLYYKHFGQMCNRLWSLLPVVAYALERKQNVYVFFAKREYLDCFPQLKNNKYIHFINTGKNEPKWLWRVDSILYRFNLFLTDDLSTFDGASPLIVIDGWKHSTDKSFIQKYRTQLLSTFSPSIDIKKKVDSCLSNYKGITIGVHIRRGDYASFLNGRYYFSDEEYLKAMISIQRQVHKNGLICRFLICSNETIEWNHEDLSLLSIPNSSGICDLYALSKCDYIIGPPSSFSQWASYYGRVPIQFILKSGDNLLLNTFSPISYFNHFENGANLSFDNKNQMFYISKN